MGNATIFRWDRDFQEQGPVSKRVKNPMWILQDMKLHHEHSDPQTLLSLQILNKMEDESAWLMAALRGGNVDVQVPYRLPFAKLRVAAHSTPTPGCSTGCATGAGCPNRILLRLLRTNQPMGVHEIKENHAPVDMVKIPLFTGFYISQVVQDFFHQQ